MLNDPYAVRVPTPGDVLGRNTPRLDDPAFQPPRDPTKATDLWTRAREILRELPLLQIQNSWTVADIRAALAAHMMGVFFNSAQLCDSIKGDDRVQSALGQRLGGLFGRPIVHKPSSVPGVKDSSAAKECYQAWTDNWDRMCPEPSLKDLMFWTIFAGFGPAQTVYDTSGPVWIPTIQTWHPAYVYWHWYLRRYVAITADGQEAIEGGDGKWILHAPFGDYRGWTWGALRPIAEPWAIRHFARRDAARYSEIHGLPTRVGGVPAASDPTERAYFETQLAGLGSSPAMIVPKGVDAANSYDYTLVEARDRGWEAFFKLREECDVSIVLALIYQNLSTEVREGSFAATQEHGNLMRQSVIGSDNRALMLTLHQQLARPFARINYGDADLAPHSGFDVQPLEDQEMAGKRLQMFGTAIEVLRRGGVQFADEGGVQEVARLLGIKLPPVIFKDPVASGGLGK